MPLRRRLPVSRAALAVIMLPVEILREILSYLDTKLIVMQDDVDWDRGQWTGTQRMRNRIQLRRRMGQTDTYPDMLLSSGIGNDLDANNWNAILFGEL